MVALRGKMLLTKMLCTDRYTVEIRKDGRWRESSPRLLASYRDLHATYRRPLRYVPTDECVENYGFLRFRSLTLTANIMYRAVPNKPNRTLFGDRNPSNNVAHRTGTPSLILLRQQTDTNDLDHRLSKSEPTCSVCCAYTDRKMPVNPNSRCKY